MSSAVATLNLLGLTVEILKEHRTDMAGRLHVIPCLVDDLATRITALTAVVHAAGGAVLNTTPYRAEGESGPAAETFNGPVEGTVPADLSAVLRGAMRFSRIGGDFWVDACSSGPNVDAKYAAATPGTAPTVTNDGVLAVTRALLSERLRSHELAVLIYDEGSLDKEQRQILWDISQFLDGLALGATRTLVLVAVGSIQMGLHVGSKTGFRFAITGDRLLHRHPEANMKAAVSNIVRSGAPFVGMFLGAGFSASSGLALGNALRDDAIRMLDQAEAGASSDELADAFYKWVESQGRLLDSERNADRRNLIADLTLERVLREEYRNFPDEAVPTLRAFAIKCRSALAMMGTAPTSLAKIIACRERRIVVCTVNFDELLDTAARGHCRAFTTDADFEKAPAHLADYLRGASDLVPLWKLHGSISDPRSCVASDEVTLMGLSGPKRRAMESLIDSTKDPVPWIYIGASMRDTDLNPFWGLEACARTLNETWVLPQTVETVEKFVHEHRMERWKQWSLRAFEERLITETADSFLSLLAAKWTS